MVQQTATTDEVVIMGDRALARGTWILHPNAAGDVAVSASGKWLTLLVRSTGGDWQIWRWMWNQEGAQEPAGG
jgi:hypothetical protein